MAPNWDFLPTFLVLLAPSLCPTATRRGLHQSLGGIPSVAFSLAHQGATPLSNLLPDAPQPLPVLPELSHHGQPPFPSAQAVSQPPSPGSGKPRSFLQPGCPSLGRHLVWVATMFLGRALCPGDATEGVCVTAHSPRPATRLLPAGTARRRPPGAVSGQRTGARPPPAAGGGLVATLSRAAPR